MVDNSKCYWQALGLCCFDPEEPAHCELDKPCMRYIREDKADDYLRELIAYNNFLEKTLEEYEEGLR